MKPQNQLRRPRLPLVASACLIAAALPPLGCRFAVSSAPVASPRARAVATPSAAAGAQARMVAASGAPLARVLENARSQVGVTVSYDPEYRSLSYPNGDVPLRTGVCSDVVVRAFRAGGANLQKLVHEDMQANFAAYPNRWGLRRTDRNIDHRRVANLQTFLARRGKKVAKSSKPGDFAPGDVVAWRLNGGLLHIGLVSDGQTTDGTPLVIHNIGAGAREEDVLFDWTIIGHYRYFDAASARRVAQTGKTTP